MTTKATLLASLGRPVVFYASVGHALGIKPGILACHLLYWTERARLGDWIYKTVEEIQAETVLTYEEQRSARASLVKEGVLEQRHARLEHRLYFRLNLDRLAELIETVGNNPHPPPGKFPPGEVGNVHVESWEHPRSSVVPESTSKSTYKEGTPPTPLRGVPPWPSPESLAALYNERKPNVCPTVTKLSYGRRRKARDLLKQFPDRGFWESVMAELGASPLLQGKKNGAGHEHWRADFDWLLEAKGGVENVVKVAEGRYRERDASVKPYGGKFD